MVRISSFLGIIRFELSTWKMSKVAVRVVGDSYEELLYHPISLLVWWDEPWLYYTQLAGHILWL